MTKKSTVKKIICVVFAACALTFSVAFGGCRVKNGRDPINGKDLNIYDIYAAVKQETGNEDLTFSDFLKEYLSYNSTELEEKASLKAAINRSLLSSVSVRARFSQSMTGYGSGVILDVDRESGDMTVVTNCHVVYSAEYVGSNNGYSDRDGFSKNINLWLYGSESNYTNTNESNAIPATLIAASKTYDLAVLKVTDNARVKISQAFSASWAAGEENYVGETVYAVGNANREMLSANVGFISKDLEGITVNLGTETNTEFYEYSVIRTSATISGGNSGGGLFNAGGEIVGIVNSRGTNETEGAGYALTSSMTRRVTARMIADYSGTATHGVRIVKHGLVTHISDCYTTGLDGQGVAGKYEEISISSVLFGKCLGKLRENDIIKHVKVVRGTGTSSERVIEDMDINREHNFNDVMVSVQPGDAVYFTVKRDGNVLEPIDIYFNEADFELVA